MINDETIDKWRRRYGVLSRVTVEGLEYVIRGLQFEELCKWSSFIKAGKGPTERVYDVDPQIAADVLHAGILYPVTPDVKRILTKAGTTNKLCNIIMNMTQFENEEYLINTYLDKHRTANMFYGMVRMKLISTYGVNVIPQLRNMTADEIIELFVYTEYASESVGMFVDILGRAEVLPRDRNGKIKKDEFMKMLFGKEYQEQTGKTNKQPPTIEDLPHKPRTIEDLQDMMDKGQKARQKISDISLEKDGQQTHVKIKDNEKRQAFNDKFTSSIDDAKSALATKIEEDRKRFGVDAPKKPGGYRGAIKDLLGE